jgi:hypothetical protein
MAISVDLRPWTEIDRLALLACQDYNLGNASDWFGCFRGGWFGMRNRIYGFQRHYYESHNWVVPSGLYLDAEYHLATMLFSMDSAIECLDFATNALGCAFAPRTFRDVTDDRAVRRICPADILDDRVSGYATHFASFTALFKSCEPMITLIIENHDVSKHRQMNFSGGSHRSDAPPGFFEMLGCHPDNPERFRFSPMREMLLPVSPKITNLARLQRAQSNILNPHVYLEPVAALFGSFISHASQCLLQDTTASVPLKVREFQR